MTKLLETTGKKMTLCKPVRNESGCQKLAEKKRAVLCDGEWCWKLAEECGQGLALTGAHE